MLYVVQGGWWRGWQLPEFRQCLSPAIFQEKRGWRQAWATSLLFRQGFDPSIQPLKLRLFKASVKSVKSEWMGRWKNVRALSAWICTYCCVLCVDICVTCVKIKKMSFAVFLSYFCLKRFTWSANYSHSPLVTITEDMVACGIWKLPELFWSCQLQPYPFLASVFIFLLRIKLYVPKYLSKA